MEKNEFKEPLLDDGDDQQIDVAAGDRNYKDVAFLGLFGVNVVFVLSVALLYGIVALASDGSEVVKVSDNGTQHYQTSEYTPSVLILLGIVSTLITAVVTTSIWIFTLSRIASFVLNAILFSIISVPIIGGFILIAVGFFMFGAALLGLSICLLVLSLFIRPRMDFAAMNLKVACGAVLQMPSVFGYALLAVGVQVLYSIIWGMAAVGYATSNSEVTIHAHGLTYDIDECTSYVYTDTLNVASYGTLSCPAGSSSCRACVCDGTFISNSSCVAPKLYGWTYCWLLLSLFWTSAVISNVVHCTTSAAVARWWAFGFPSAQIVQEGFERATTTSLGSICFGSLLVAIVRTMRSILYFATKQLNKVESSGVVRQLQSCFLGALKYILNVMDRLVVYFNRYALCFVAIYRYDFIKGSKAASNLFVRRGFTTLLNDDIIDIVLNIGHVIIGTTSMSMGYVFGRLSGVGHAYTMLLTVFGFAAGYLISIVALSTISSAVATVYVCYVDNPLALQMSHPDMYVPLSEAWAKMTPGTAGSGKKTGPQGGGGNQGTALEGGAMAGASNADQPQAGANIGNMEVPRATRIKGSFGGSDASSDRTTTTSSASSGSSGVSGGGNGGFVTPSSGPDGGAFAAGFAFIASMFPSQSVGADFNNQRMQMKIKQAPTSGANNTRQGGVVGGGYASLPSRDPTAEYNNNQYQQRHTQEQQAYQSPFGQANPPQQQSPYMHQQMPAQRPYAQPWGPTSNNIHGGAGGPGPPSSAAGRPHMYPPQGEPMFSPQFAQALTAINSLTTKLSSSVFNAVSGGGNAGAAASAANVHRVGMYGTPYEAGETASMMSVPLEESFSV